MYSFYLKFFLFSFLALAFFGCKSDDNSSNPNDPKAENRKGLGDSAEDILSSDIYNSLTVQLAFSVNSRPSQTALDNLENFLEERVNKPGGVTMVETIIEDQPGAPFDTQEIKNIEDEVRTQYTEGDDIAVFVFFSNGRSINDSQTTLTLGSAYQNTSIVVYENTLKILTQNNMELLPILESAVINHEFGHILGLTNISNDDIHQVHEDPNQDKHCIIEDCLMYFDATNVGRASLERMIQRGSVPELDPLCISDLQAKGGK